MLLSEAAGVMQGRLEGADARFTGCSTDSRSIRAGELFVALRGEHFDGHAFIGAAAARGAAGAVTEILPAAAPVPLLEVADSRRALGDLAAAWRRRFSIPLVAITGSNGKTSVKEMTAAILNRCGTVLYTRGNLNNDIGLPLTLMGLGAAHTHAVVEMGANHPGEIRRLAEIALPDIAVITQCAPAHLEGFGTVEGVARAKGEIFEGTSAQGTAVINADDAFAPLWRQLAGSRRQLTFGLVSPADLTARDIRAAGAGHAFELVSPEGRVAVQLGLPGRHNILNALAAAGCALAAGAPLDAVAAGLGDLEPVKGRLQRKAGRRGALIIDDTYNANPASLRAALAVLADMPGKRWLVLGDMGELGPSAAALHREAGEAAREAGVARLFTVGELTAYAAAAFGAGAAHYESVEQITTAVQRRLDAGVTVLVKGSRAMGMERVVAGLIEET